MIETLSDLDNSCSSHKILKAKHRKTCTIVKCMGPNWRYYILWDLTANPFPSNLSAWLHLFVLGFLVTPHCLVISLAIPPRVSWPLVLFSNSVCRCSHNLKFHQTLLFSKVMSSPQLLPSTDYRIDSLLQLWRHEPQFSSMVKKDTILIFPTGLGWRWIEFKCIEISEQYWERVCSSKEWWFGHLSSFNCSMHKYTYTVTNGVLN